jgi:putative addiction module killer protein
MFPSPPFTVLYYETPDGRRPVIQWMETLDAGIRSRVTARVERFEHGNFGDHKPLKAQPGLFEARLQFGPGYRLYFAKEPRRIVLLWGGDKRSQRADLRAAAAMYRQYRQEH